MAIQSVTQLLAAAEKLKKNPAPPSEVGRLVEERKVEIVKAGNYFKSEKYFKAQANRIKYMIAVYGNLGLSGEKAAMEAEAVKLIKEYTKLYGVPENIVKQDA